MEFSCHDLSLEEGPRVRRDEAGFVDVAVIESLRRVSSLDKMLLVEKHMKC